MEISLSAEFVLTFAMLHRDESSLIVRGFSGFGLLSRLWPAMLRLRSATDSWATTRRISPGISMIELVSARDAIKCPIVATLTSRLRTCDSKRARDACWCARLVSNRWMLLVAIWEDNSRLFELLFPLEEPDNLSVFIINHLTINSTTDS